MSDEIEDTGEPFDLGTRVAAAGTVSGVVRSEQGGAARTSIVVEVERLSSALAFSPGQRVEVVRLMPVEGEVS